MLCLTNSPRAGARLEVVREVVLGPGVKLPVALWVGNLSLILSRGWMVVSSSAMSEGGGESSSISEPS